MAEKPNMGRQKIKLAKIEIKNHLQVTFSKRRTGLFKKASELCTLCGVEIAIIVFSPAGKVFSFGNPNVESILDRFLDRTRSINYPSLLDAHRVSSVGQLNLKLSQIVNQIEVERERGEALQNVRKNNRIHHWWESPVSELGFHELEKLRDAMEELKESVNHHQAQHPTTSYLDMNNVGVFCDQYEAKPTQAFGCFGNNFGFF